MISVTQRIWKGRGACYPTRILGFKSATQNAILVTAMFTARHDNKASCFLTIGYNPEVLSHIQATEYNIVSMCVLMGNVALILKDKAGIVLHFSHCQQIQQSDGSSLNAF